MKLYAFESELDDCEEIYDLFMEGIDLLSCQLRLSSSKLYSSDSSS